MLMAMGAVTVTIDGASVVAVYSADYAESLDIDGTLPALRCRNIDVADFAPGVAVSVPDVGEYEVRRIRPHHSGIWTVELTEA